MQTRILSNTLNCVKDIDGTTPQETTTGLFGILLLASDGFTDTYFVVPQNLFITRALQRCALALQGPVGAQ